MIMGKLISGSLLIFLGQVMVWFQLYGALKIEYLKKNIWFTYGTAIPITMLFYYGIKHVTEAFGGSMWPSRFLSFTLGVISFSVLTWYFNNESIDMKTGVCLGLSLLIIIIQIMWK